MDARQVDALRFWDFAQYILQIDQWYENEKKRWAAMNNQGG